MAYTGQLSMDWYARIAGYDSYYIPRSVSKEK